MSSNEIKTYRIYFFNAQNRITDTAVLDCSDDQVCVERALALLREHRDYRAVEIWQENRKVGLYDRPSSGTDSGSPPQGNGSST
jgi:hypothetical protein